jgi:hypothetical protein
MIQMVVLPDETVVVPHHEAPIQIRVAVADDANHFTSYGCVQTSTNTVAFQVAADVESRMPIRAVRAGETLLRKGRGREGGGEGGRLGGREGGQNVSSKQKPQP